MSGWKIGLEGARSKLKYITFVENNKELGNFLLNLNDEEYVVRDIYPTYHDELKESLKFMKKDSKIEFGKEGN